MTLATRCPSCVTVFKVVQDQLRVSDGWVRCGRCNEVFNAVDHLIELAPPAPASAALPPRAGEAAAGWGAGVAAGTAGAADIDAAMERNAVSGGAGGSLAGRWADTAAPTPDAWPAPSAAMEDRPGPFVEPEASPARTETDPAFAPTGFDIEDDPRHGPADDPPFHAPGPWTEDLDRPASTPVEPPPDARDVVLDPDERRSAEGPFGAEPSAQTGTDAEAGRPGAGGRADTPFGTEPGEPVVSLLTPSSGAPPGAAGTAPWDAPLPAETPPPVPGFLREAERAARWQRPAVRRALMAGCAGAALLLAAQVGLEYRDVLAARWPALQPPLEAACRLAGCRIEPPRWIEAVAVDSSGLVRVEGTSTYRFSVVLANRAGFALALPSIDLTLTDVRGQVVARRMLRPLDLGHEGDRLEPGTELPLRATLAVGERVVAGYTIEIYYP
jgi:predicted Zn finger-like uncharacterized protein